MPATSSELIEQQVSDTAREPLSRKGRPFVVDIDEILTDANFIQRRIARWITVNPSRLSFDQDVIASLLQAMGSGRPVYLCSERYPESFVNSVAQHLGVFSAWSATRGSKAATDEAAGLPLMLCQGFDYLGPRTLDLPGVASRIQRPAVSGRVESTTADVWAWARLLRVHQWSKNALVLVPLLTAHKFALLPAATAVLAAIAFSLCASSAYVLNDIVDVTADRAHPTKRNRPIASGAIAVPHAILALVLVLVPALAIAFSISLAFCGMLLGYLALTVSYSFWLKRIAIVDVVTLAILYTVRVIGGAVAIGVTMSEWLFAFSLFIFMSLALVKRHVELAGQPQGRVLAARDYQADDKSMVAILAATAGFNAVVIFTLYISSDAVRTLYSHPQLLWISCPVLMCWIGRVMLLTQRGLIDDDPVIFALRDRFSWLALGVIGAVLLAAI